MKNSFYGIHYSCRRQFAFSESSTFNRAGENSLGFVVYGIAKHAAPPLDAISDLVYNFMTIILSKFILI